MEGKFIAILDGDSATVFIRRYHDTETEVEALERLVEQENLDMDNIEWMGGRLTVDICTHG